MYGLHMRSLPPGTQNSSRSAKPDRGLKHSVKLAWQEATRCARQAVRSVSMREPCRFSDYQLKYHKHPETRPRSSRRHFHGSRRTALTSQHTVVGAAAFGGTQGSTKARGLTTTSPSMQWHESCGKCICVEAAGTESRREPAFAVFQHPEN